MIIFAECVSNGGATIYESTSGGAVTTFTQVFTTADPSYFGETLVIDPSNTQVMYFGSYRVYQSTDGGQTWTLISGDLTRNRRIYLGLGRRSGNECQFWVHFAGSLRDYFRRQRLGDHECGS